MAPTLFHLGARVAQLGSNMAIPQTGPEALAQRTGFKPYEELTPEQQRSVIEYWNKWYSGYEPNHWSWYYWKESTIGDNNWISFDISPHNRIVAPHLKESKQ